jgi:hypothetical protein
MPEHGGFLFEERSCRPAAQVEPHSWRGSRVASVSTKFLWWLRMMTPKPAGPQPELADLPPPAQEFPLCPMFAPCGVRAFPSIVRGPRRGPRQHTHAKRTRELAGIRANPNRSRIRTNPAAPKTRSNPSRSKVAQTRERAQNRTNPSCSNGLQTALSGIQTNPSRARIRTNLKVRRNPVEPKLVRDEVLGQRRKDLGGVVRAARWRRSMPRSATTKVDRFDCQRRNVPRY